jgi:hypothetical protein
MFRELLAYADAEASEGFLFEVQRHAYSVSPEYRQMLEDERRASVTQWLKLRRMGDQLLATHRNKEVWFKPYENCFVRCLLLRRKGRQTMLAKVLAPPLDEAGNPYRKTEALYWRNQVGEVLPLAIDRFQTLESHPFAGSKDPKNEKRPVYKPGGGTRRAGGSLE